MTTAAAPLGGHLLHVVPLLVPVVAIAAVLLPDVVRKGWRSLCRRPLAHPPVALVLASSGTLAAAAVHLLVMPEHVEESWLYGGFFAVLATAQVGCAWLLLGRPSRPVLGAAALGNTGVIVLWLVTRTTGLPFGPFAGQVERVGVLDVTAVAAELVAVLACGALLRRPEAAHTFDARSGRYAPLSHCP